VGGGERGASCPRVCANIKGSEREFQGGPRPALIFGRSRSVPVDIGVDGTPGFSATVCRLRAALASQVPDVPDLMSGCAKLVRFTATLFAGVIAIPRCSMI
jgi:hypothetical protein